MSKFEISKEDTKKMQRIGLKMVKYFDAFCSNHGLTYFLCGGNCIGAIRNKGFIEWDDDVDVFMPRKDYEKLQRIWQDTDDYIIQFNRENQPNYATSVTIHDRNTTFVKTTICNRDIAQGVAMDVFPLDPAPNGIKRKIQQFWAIVYSIYSICDTPKNHGTLIRLLGHIPLFLLPTRKIRFKMAKFAERKMSKYKINECDNITELCAGPGYMMNDYPKEIFSDSIRVEFEDTMLPIPIGYDQYLKIAFGDYMSLPPIEKRVNHHEYEFIDLDTPYLSYRGIEYLKNN